MPFHDEDTRQKFYTPNTAKTDLEMRYLYSGKTPKHCSMMNRRATLLKAGLLLMLMTPLLYTSCVKDKCIEEVLGTYKGTESCPGINSNLTFIVTLGAEENSVVFNVQGSNISFKGTLNDDCSVINIPSQNIPGIGSVNGSFSLSGINMTGNLTYPLGTCSYSMTKQ